MLTGKICLVTGASRGIGRTIVHTFAQNGATVYANIRTSGCLDEWIKSLSEDVGSRIIPICFDVTDVIELKNAIVQIKREQGKIDVLVNNAAVAFNEAIGMISAEHVKKMFETNVYATIETIQLVSRIMKRCGRGSIINISSIVGVEGDKGQMAYSATKGAVISLTKSAAKELAGNHIRVNSVAPGLTETDMLRETKEEFLQERIGNIGMKRLATPQDIANACLFFASDLSEYVTGQVLGVNGSSIL